MKFRKPKERVKVCANKEGLQADNRIHLKGNKGSGKKNRDVQSSLASFHRDMESDEAHSSYPDLNMDGSKSRLARLARMDSPSPPPSRPTVPRGAMQRFAPREGPTSASSITRNNRAPNATPVRTTSFGRDSDDLDSVSSSSSSIISSRSSASVDSATSSMSGSLSSVEASRNNRVPVSKGLLHSLGSKNAQEHSAGGISQKEAEEAEKNDLLARFHILRQRGIILSKNFTSKSSLQEMRMEMGRIEHENKMARSIRINRRFCLMGASGLTKLTDNYAPSVLRGRWHGFDKHMLDCIEDFDEPFERLSEQYGGVVTALSGGNPLMEIIVLFLYQFITYAVTNKGEHAKTKDDMAVDEALKRYPNIIREAVEKELQRRETEQAQQAQREQRNQQYAPMPPPPMQQQWYARPTPPMPMQPPRDFNFMFPPAPSVPPMESLNRQEMLREAKAQAMADSQQQQQHAYAAVAPALPPAQNLYKEQTPFGSHDRNPPPLMPVPMKDTSFMLDAMMAPLPHVDVRTETEAPNARFAEGNGDDEDLLYQYEQPQEMFSDDEDNQSSDLELPVVTRVGRPTSLKTPPINKRDASPSLMSINSRTSAETGKEELVVNIA